MFGFNFCSDCSNLIEPIVAFKFQRGLNSLVARLPASPPDVEALRVYAVLPFYHEFLDPENRASLQIPFAENVLQLPAAASKVVG